MVKTNKIIPLLILLLFTGLSIRPLLFTSNYFLYLYHQHVSESRESSIYLLRSLALSPLAYRSLVVRDAPGVLLLAAIVEEDPRLLDSLTLQEREEIDLRFKSNLYYRNLLNDLKTGLTFERGKNLSDYILIKTMYNPLTFSIINRLDKDDYREYFEGFLNHNRKLPNKRLIKFIKSYLNE